MILTIQDFKGILPHVKYISMLAYLREKLLIDMPFKPQRGSFKAMYHFDGQEAVEAMIRRGVVDNKPKNIRAFNERLEAIKEAIRIKQCE